MSDEDNAKEMARAIGLDRLVDAYPDDVARAFAFAKSLTDRLPRDLAPAEEPAHVYRAGVGDDAPRDNSQ